MNPSPTTSSPRSRFLLPSFADLVFILLLIALAYGTLAPRLLWDGDVGWHIRNGQNILATHAIPRTDSFSATRFGQPWYSWEWLYDLLIGFIDRHLGLNGVVFFSAFVIAGTAALVFRITLRRGGTLAITLLLFLLSLVASSIHFLARPHVVSWLLAVIWFRILDYYQKDEARALLWLLPVLMVLWVNLHGGFVLGFVLLGIFFAATVIELAFATDSAQRLMARKQVSRLGIILVACAAASLVNPYGYKLHVHVYRYLSSRFFMQHIDEFRAPGLHGLPAQFFVLLLAMTIVGVLVARLRLRWSEWLLIAFSGFSGLWAARNIPLSSMFLAMIAGPLLSRAASDGKKSGWRAFLQNRELGQYELRFRGHIWPAALVIFTLMVCLNHGKLLREQLMDAHFDAARFPVYAVDGLSRSGNNEPVFCPDSWGGYLIYRRSPAQKVFIDDRHDFYGEDYIREYLRVLHREAGWQQVLDKWGVNLVIFPAHSELSDALRQQGWTNPYQDKTASVFVRGNAAQH